MPGTDDLTSALDQIKARNIKAQVSSSVRDIAAGADDVPRLLAAVEKVLKLADEAAPGLSAPPADCTYACDSGSCDCSGKSRPLVWNLDPAEIREAITRELTKRGPDHA